MDARQHDRGAVTSEPIGVAAIALRSEIWGQDPVRSGWKRPALGSHWLVAGALLASAIVGCSDPASSAGDAGVAADSQSSGADAASSGDSEDVAKPSCLGVAADSRALFAQFDEQCAFLTDCSASGQCSCGSGCKADETMCSAAICQGIDADCSCGDACPKDGSVTICPNYVCNELGKITGCAKQPGCRFVDKERAAKCACTSMPDTEPNCYCGACEADKTLCAVSKCVGKNPDKCIIVPGQKWTGPYCARCGLFAGKPRCFFVITPEAP